MNKKEEHKLLAYKKSQAKIAVELGYGDKVVNKISEAVSEIEIDRIMKTARGKIKDKLM